METQEKQEEKQILNDIILKLEDLTNDVKTILSDKSKKCRDKSKEAINVCEDFFGGNDNVEIRLNVDGKLFFSCWSEIRKHPETRLGKLSNAKSEEEILQLCDNYNADSSEFYFKRRNSSFGEILEFYRSGTLHISQESCVIAFEQDMHYWGVEESFLETCCSRKLLDAKEMLKKLDDDVDESIREQFPPGTRGRVQKYLWDLFEYPHSSHGAQLVGLISVTSIILSIIILTLDTFPYFMQQKNTLFGDYIVFAIMEAVYIAWFTFELLIRLICCPSKSKFLKQVMNWIDLVAIVPYFIMLALHLTLLKESGEGEVVDTNSGTYRRLPQVFRLLRILKILRFIARFFKLARHSIGMQALGYTMRSKYKELSLVLLFLGMGAIIFASITFVFESDAKDTQFKTMLDGYWWAVITMTTVGYGDISPVTRMGKVIGTLCAVFGVLIVALPIPIIGGSFTQYYDREKRRQKFIMKEAAASVIVEACKKTSVIVGAASLMKREEKACKKTSFNGRNSTPVQGNANKAFQDVPL